LPPYIKLLIAYMKRYKKLGQWLLWIENSCNIQLTVTFTNPNEIFRIFSMRDSAVIFVIKSSLRIPAELKRVTTLVSDISDNLFHSVANGCVFFARSCRSTPTGRFDGSMFWLQYWLPETSCIVWPTQPSTLSGAENEYWPKCRWGVKAGMVHSR